MTPAVRIYPPTAMGLLFGPGANASEALARQILPKDADLDRALKRLPPPTRQAAVREAATQAAALTAIHPGSCDATAALNFEGTDVLTTRTHLGLPGVIEVSPAIRLLRDDHPAGREASQPAA